MSKYDTYTAITKASRLVYKEFYAHSQPSKPSTKEVSAKQPAKASTTTRPTGRSKSESKS